MQAHNKTVEEVETVLHKELDGKMNPKRMEQFIERFRRAASRIIVDQSSF